MNVERPYFSSIPHVRFSMKVTSGSPLSADHLDVVTAALLTLASLAPSPARTDAIASARAPSAKGLLLPVSALVVDDAPWFSERR